jgi:uncharacterized protein (DUF488 family)
MYYRRKYLLSLLQIFDGKLGKKRLQKLLFLSMDQLENKLFYFVPYHYGCFSFQADADLQTMQKYNLVFLKGKYWIKSDANEYFMKLRSSEKKALIYVKQNFEKLSEIELIRFTYLNFPYYSIKSKIASKILKQTSKREVENGLEEKNDILFTIGYEGISFEEYLNKLIKNNIKILIDVRKRAGSMKFGFNKSQLRSACRGLGIDYRHFPELGIDSEKRDHLNSQDEYDNLFIYYREKMLPDLLNKQQAILTLLKEKQRIALTCFEANIHQCHRKHLAESLSRIAECPFPIKHI